MAVFINKILEERNLMRSASQTETQVQISEIDGLKKIVNSNKAIRKAILCMLLKE